MAAAGEYVVQRVGKIRRGVNKSTVEIEDNGRRPSALEFCHTRLAGTQAAA